MSRYSKDAIPSYDLMGDTLKSWKMQPAFSSPYPFDTQRATLKMGDMVDNFCNLFVLQIFSIVLCIRMCCQLSRDNSRRRVER